MELAEYQPFWETVRDPMIVKMQELAMRLRQRLGPGLQMTDPALNEDADEFKVYADVQAADGTPVLNIDFVLADGDENDASGVGITLELTGYNALALGNWTPYAYSERAFTFDRDELLARVAGLDTDALATYIMTDALQNEVLKRETRDAGLAI